VLNNAERGRLLLDLLNKQTCVYKTSSGKEMLLQRENVIKLIKRMFFISFGGVLLLLLGACVSIQQVDSQSIDQGENAELTALELANEDSQITLIAPPKLDLDADTLEQLMIANFASYAGDWVQAASGAYAAAQSSKDFRLARMASVLALRAENYTQVSEASALWYQLDSDNQDAYNTLLIGLVGSGKVDTALQHFDEHLSELEDIYDSDSYQNTNAQALQDSSPTQSEYVANTPLDIFVRQLAGLLISQKNVTAALEICSRLIAREPESAQVLLSA